MTLVDIDVRAGNLVITESNGKYNIVQNGYIRHPDLSAEETIRALGHYLHSAEYTLSRLSDWFWQNDGKIVVLDYNENYVCNQTFFVV